MSEVEFSRIWAELQAIRKKIRKLVSWEEMTRNHARATTAAGQSIPDDGSFHTIVYGTETYDTGSEYNPATGEFTCGRAGRLHVDAACTYAASTTWSGTDAAWLAIHVDGAQRAVIHRQDDHSGANIYVFCQGSQTISVGKGEVVTIRARQTSGGALSLYANSAYNHVCFDWLN